MEVSENFAFLAEEFHYVAESASFAERHVYGDPRASCFHARHALERLVIRIFRIDKTLTTPEAAALGDYIYDPAFCELVPQAVWQKAEYIREAGNTAVHGKKAPSQSGHWDWCVSYTTSSTGRAAPICGRARRICAARPSTSRLSPS